LTDAIIDSIILRRQEEYAMAQLIVRQLGEKVPRKLKERARRHAVSMEEEHRRILQRALDEEGPEESLKDLLLSMPNVGRDSDFTRIPQKRREVDL
jgi:plasmid stability protein